MIIATPSPTILTYRKVTLQDRLRDVAREVPAKPALILGHRILSYAEPDARTDRLAAAPAPRGAPPGLGRRGLRALGRSARRVGRPLRVRRHGRSRRSSVHERDDRLSQGRDAHAREPHREPAAVLRGGPGPARRCFPQRPAVLPHLRAE